MKKIILIFAFFMFSIMAVTAAEKTVNVFLIGPGLVGGELLHQIDQGFSSEQPIEVRVVGLANSRLMRFDPKGIDLKNWKEQLAESSETMSCQAFIDRMVELGLPNSVFVDCTTDPSVADAYPTVLQSRVPIATPNKKANSGPFSTYSALKNLSEQNHTKFLYDANVGAGLPIIHAIQSIKRSRDSIVKIEAILSGTLSYLFNTFDGTVPFSEVVREAQKMGITEPDPRDDLNGMDMARKILILARESGLEMEMGGIELQRFLPDACFEAASVSAFYQNLADFDGELSALAKEANQKGQVLRFIGTLENGRASISLQAVGPDHPFYLLTGTNNIASITSRYWNRIVIKGPGAGAQVTAASVLSNIIQAGLDL